MLATLAEARRISTQALVEDDYDQALLLALEGRHFDDSPESRDNLLATIQRSPYATSVIRSDTQAFLDLGFTADGSTAGGRNRCSVHSEQVRRHHPRADRRHSYRGGPPVQRGQSRRPPCRDVVDR